MKELIVVEGKKDAAIVHRAFPHAHVLITHGWGLGKEQIRALQKANQRRGVIVFTDPDHAGELIRRRLSSLLPGCKHAFLPREKAAKNGEIGVEVASVEDVRAALSKVHSLGQVKASFDIKDLLAHGLVGAGGAAGRRRRLGKYLSIGDVNAKTFLWRLNAFGITRAEFKLALKKMEADDCGCD